MSKGTTDISKFFFFFGDKKKNYVSSSRKIYFCFDSDRSLSPTIENKKKLKLAAVETAATSCSKGVIGIKACSNDQKKKIGARSGKTIGARRSGDDVGSSRTSDNNDR